MVMVDAHDAAMMRGGAARVAALLGWLLAAGAVYDESVGPVLPPDAPDLEGNASGSTIRFSTLFGMNVAVARRACVRRGVEVVLLRRPGAEPLLGEALRHRLSTQGQYGFRFGW